MSYQHNWQADQQDSEIELLPPNSRQASLENQAVHQRLFNRRINPRQPMVMCVFFIAGVGLAIGHHAFYQSMSGTIVQSTESQQWAIRIGSLFALLATVSFRVCVVAAYTQMIWYTFRRHDIEISAIDKIFTLTSDPLSFLDLKVLRTASLGVFAALVAWSLPLAAIAPPATLSVGFGNSSSTTSIPMSGFNWTAKWLVDRNTERTKFLYPVPASSVLLFARRVANRGAIIAPPAPAPNSTFHYEVHGPSVLCRKPIRDEIPAFQYLANSLAINLEVAVAKPEAFPNSSHPGLLIYTTLKPNGNDEIDFGGVWTRPERGKNRTQQLWVQTSDTSIVCSLVNSSFMVQYSYLNSQPTVIYSSTTDREIPDPGILNASSGVTGAYFSAFVASMASIDGNVTAKYDTALEELRQGGRSNVLSTGLSSCREFTDTSWMRPNRYNNNSIIYSPFAQEEWLCRNQTLDRAIEDLANNITISLLTLQELTKRVKSNVSVSVWATVVLYNYSPLRLIVSYVLAAVFTLICLVMGFLAMHWNGVTHDSSFSCLMCTTRNADLDVMVIKDGLTVGAGTASEALGKVQLRYGFLENRIELQTSDDHAKHVAFGLPSSVKPLGK